MTGALFAFGLVVCGASLNAAPSGEIRVVGSDLLGVDFSKALYGFAADHGIQLALALDGSRPGVAELQAGRADVALLALPAEEEFADPAFESIPVGYHRVVVIAPAACPLEQITFEQLVGAFAGSGAAPVERWGDLGMIGEWAASPLVASAPEVGTGIAVEYFRRVVLRDRAFKSNVERYANPAALARHFSVGRSVLALAPDFPPDASTMKLLAIASETGGAAVHPTAENLHRGDYPLRLPLHLVFRRADAERLSVVLRFLMGDDAAPHLERAGVVPVPAEVRADRLAALQQL